MNNTTTQCGFIALCGRPNVGKSTLMNQLVGRKISITTNKPQTTRHQILGIKTTQNIQAIYVDTPGIHQKAKKAINRYMNRVASSVLDDVDLIVLVVEAGVLNAEDENVINLLKDKTDRVIVVVNKVDKIKKSKLAEYLMRLSGMLDCQHYVPVSALNRENVDELEKLLLQQLPDSPFLFPEEQTTDKSREFQITETVREKLVASLMKELPYSINVTIEKQEQTDKLDKIYVIVWVERKSQKHIVIGKQGATLKEIGQAARLDLESQLGKKVYLEIWVKVKEDWADSDADLKQFGFQE